jgi:SAM-dependent methyltransferase
MKKVRAVLDIVAVFLRAFAGRVHEKGWKSAFIYLRWFFNAHCVAYRNTHARSTRSECPCCGWKGFDFVPVDGVAFWVPRSVCPNCLAFDRHRSFHLYVQKYDRRLLDMSGYLLNYAPESYVRNLLLANPCVEYISSDMELERLHEPKGRAFRSDILHIPLPDNSVDAEVCFHLLEHLQDDRAGIREMHRVLKPGGVAYIMVPINLRLRETEYFGRPHPDVFDHWWAPARDYIERFREFECQEVEPKDYLTREEAFRYGVPAQEIVFRCVKRHQVF